MSDANWLNEIELGIGNWAWGDTFFWGRDGGDKAADSRQAFVATMEAGLRLIDTAEVYMVWAGRSTCWGSLCTKPAIR